MKKITWPIALVLAISIMLFSPLLMGMEFVLFIDAIGLDMFVMLLEAQILVTAGLIFAKAKQSILYIHNWMMERDTNYFIPSKETLRTYPPIIIHAVPSLVALPILVLIVSGRAMLDI